MDYSVKRFRDVHDGPVSCIAWSPVLVGALVSGGVDGNVRVWDVPSSTCIRTLVGTGRKITYVAFDTQNHVLASTDDGQVLVWDLNVSSIISRTLPSGSSTAGPPHSVLQPSRVFMNSGGAPIKNLIYDPDSQSCLIVFNARSQAGIQRRKIKDGSVMTKFNNAHVSPVVCSVWDKLVSGATERNSSILVTGDQLGTICIWEIPESAGYADKELVPLRSIPAAHAFELAHIYLDPFKMVSVDVRGIIRVWDLMTTVCIRALNSKRCRNREEGENEPLVNAQTVNLIWAGPYQVIVCLGNSIKSWNFDPFQSLHLGNRKKKGRSVSRNHHHHGGNPARASLRMQARSPRQQFLSEMREDIQQVAEEREYERQAGQQNAAALARMNGSLQDPRSGMTEDELVSYAMMISMEEQQQQQQGRGIPPAGPGMPSRSGSSLGQSPRSASAWTTPLTPSRSSPRHGSSYNSQRCNSWHSRQAHNDWDDDEEEDETQNDLETSNLYSPRHHHGRPLELDVDWDSSAAELSTSGGRRRLFYGMSTSGGSRSTTATSGPDNLHSRYASSAAGILLRSPGLYPQRASASQYGGGQPQGNVSTVSPNNWDEELQYVLEMSLHDQ